MSNVVSLCGFRCDLCLAYRPNIESEPENAQVLSDGWQRYFGFRIPPEQIICDGCLSESETLLDSDCPVRPCARQLEVKNCAACDDYICEKLTQRLIDFDSIQSQFDQPIPEIDRLNFILPYENRERLEQLRSRKP